MKPNDRVDVSVQTDVDAGELLALLSDPAVQGAWEDGETIHLYWPADQWSGDRLLSVRTVLAHLGLTSSVPLFVNRVPYQDWNQQWARSVTPLRIGRLDIRPSWEPVSLGPEEIEIVLDPKQAFGTGHHATTRMLLEWLQDSIHGEETVLDVGSGSAILAMTAVKLGAVSATGVECDPIAMGCARDYVIQNRLAHAIDLVCGTLDDVAQRGRLKAQLVLANLDRQTLLQLAGELSAYGHAGARLMVSGILADQRAEIMECFANLGFACCRAREQDGWVALELMTPESCEGAA